MRSAAVGQSRMMLLNVAHDLRWNAVRIAYRSLSRLPLPNGKGRLLGMLLCSIKDDRRVIRELP